MTTLRELIILLLLVSIAAPVLAGAMLWRLWDDGAWMNLSWSLLISLTVLLVWGGVIGGHIIRK